MDRPYESLIRKIVELPAPNLLALASDAESTLALLLLLDQISRKIMRGSDAAWVYTTCDPVALHVAHHSLRQQHDKDFPPHKKLWFCLVLCHSESLRDQELAVAKTASLTHEIRSTLYNRWHSTFKEALDYAIKYYLTIDRFGRFPHRNEVLNRESTDDEKAYLETKRWNF